MSRPKLFHILDRAEGTPAHERILSLLTDTELSLATAAAKINRVFDEFGIAERVSISAVTTYRARTIGGYKPSPGSHDAETARAVAETARLASQEGTRLPAEGLDYDPTTNTGRIVTNDRIERGEIVPARDLTAWLLDAGLDPDIYEVTPGTTRLKLYPCFYRDADTGEMIEHPLQSRAFEFRERSDAETHDIPALFAAARERAFADVSAPTGAPRRAGVVVLGDLQIGKAGEARGGTPELITRLESIRGQIAEHISTRNLSHGILLDAGDVVEGDQSAGAVKGLVSNDLSPMAQVDLAVGIEWEFLTTLLDHAPSVVASAVPSNHAAWRRGADTLGGPHDDWGIFAARQLERLASVSRADGRVDVVLPDEHEESIRLDVYGHGLGLVHGHRTRGTFARWYSDQCAGRGAVANSEVVVSGHFHHLIVEPLGISDTGTHGWHLQAPSADGGSGWFRHSKGDANAQAGVIYFEIDEETGFDLASLRLFSAPWERSVPERKRFSVG